MSGIGLGISNVFTFLLTALSILKQVVFYGIFVWAAFVIGMFLFVKKVQDFNRFSRFGKTIFYAARYSANVIKTVRSSQFYMPMHRLLKSDPSIVMLILGAVLAAYITHLVITSIAFVLQAWHMALFSLLAGGIFTGLWQILGAVILTALAFVLALMLFMFINFLFSMFGRVSRFAERYVRPLQQVLEGAGVSPNWSFFFLYIILSIFQQAFTALFF